MRIVEHRAQVVEAIQAKLPDVFARSYGGRFDLAELEAVSLRTPGILVAVLGHAGQKGLGDGRHSLDLRMVAFVVTKDTRSIDRDTAALNLCEILCAWLPHQRFGGTGRGDAGDVRWQNLFSGKARKGAVTLNAVSWQQRVVVGGADPDFPGPDQPIPETVYLGTVPKIGLGNEPYYEELTADG